MLYPDGEILVMARAPVAGKAKTRLVPALGAEGAATLHRYLVERLLSELSDAALANITLFCTPDISAPFFDYCQRHYGVSLQQQEGSDLGARLYHALHTSLDRCRYAIVVGCDIPELGVADIRSAFAALQRGDDAAITPTYDGGYALLAVSQAEPSLFEGISWGSTEVMVETRVKLNRLGWHYCELEQRWDVDLPDDLQRLAKLSLPKEIMQLIDNAMLSRMDDEKGIERQQEGCS